MLVGTPLSRWWGKLPKGHKLWCLLEVVHPVISTALSSASGRSFPFLCPLSIIWGGYCGIPTLQAKLLSWFGFSASRNLVGLKFILNLEYSQSLLFQADGSFRSITFSKYSRLFTYRILFYSQSCMNSYPHDIPSKLWFLELTGLIEDLYPFLFCFLWVILSWGKYYWLL